MSTDDEVSIVDVKKLKLMAKCFSGDDEACEFHARIMKMCEDLEFHYALINRTADVNAKGILWMKMVCIVTLFYRNNMDLLMELSRYAEMKRIKRKDLHEEYEEWDGSDNNSIWL